MQFDWNGKSYRYDQDAVGTKVAGIITKETGFKFPVSLLNGMEEGDPFAWQAQIWLVLLQNGEAPNSIDDVDFPLLPFMTAFSQAMAKEYGIEVPEDPRKAVTEPAVDGSPTTTSGSSETATS